MQDLIKRQRFDPWVRKIPWRRKWQSTPMLLPRRSHGQRSMVGYSPWGRKESDTSEWLTVDLQSCVNFCCRAKWFSYICIFFFFILFSIIVFLRILNIASGFCLQRVYSSLPVWEAWLQQRWGCGLWALRDLGSNSSGSTNWSWARRLNSSLFRFFFPICNIGVKSAFGRFAKVETTVSTVPGT